ncbi:hypothetical protein RHVG_00006 [Rhodovulum phage RS1]|uniref:hypothetical protein n=1 Tax=Rhodobacter phage RC1 TaxID=754055 RepID=UPI0002C18628|nr:hypothetical protein RHWG_00050 [Rhodobacter phage RC1]YP_007676385.1 hypothetical protein RHVG_00006 [Rhodovulum phage RS1]AGH57971.1 hypothetical protein RHVG_00006 [Rhodovulum phage RS1]AGH58071.1 hypothetical protein RHWG_00050 [Rhodobacter phage RC1]
MAGKTKTAPHVFSASGGAFYVMGLPEASPQFPNKAEAEKWMRAEIAKLPERKRPRKRRCLCCTKSFESDGIHNRLCNRCRAYGAILAM